MLQFLWTLLAVLACGCLTPGCSSPVLQPVWNPDSRSFFYTRRDGAIIQYDLDKQASRTLLPSGPQRPTRVALSPASPLVGFAQTALGKDSRAVQVGVFSLLDGRTTWSPLEIWGERKSERIIGPTACYFSPQGDRILIWYQQPEEVSRLDDSAAEQRFAIYDVQTRQLTELTTAPPAVELAQGINVSPLCPDGSGYLATTKDNESGWAYVSWEGWESPLEMDPEFRTKLQQLKAEGEGALAKMDAPHLLPQGVWTGNALRFPTPLGVICLDAGTRKYSLEPLSEQQQSEFRKIAAADRADAPWVTRQVASFSSGSSALHYREKLNQVPAPCRLELVETRTSHRRVLLEGWEPSASPAHGLFPSPDGRFILACLHDQGKSWIHVVQSDGTILTKVDAGLVPKGGK